MKLYTPLLMLITLVVFFSSYNFKNKSQFIDDLKEYSFGTLANLEIFEDQPAAPRTSFKDREGNNFSLHSFTGKIIVANFWATWCVPCRVEMPDLEKLARLVANENIKVITISIDRKGFEVIDPFLNDIGVEELEVYLDQSNRLSLEVGAIGLPTTLIIGPSGKMVARLVGPAKWDSGEVLSFLNKIQ